MFSVDVPEPVTSGFDSAAVTPPLLGETVAVKVTMPANPVSPVTVTVDIVLPPALHDKVVGAALTVNDAATG